MQQKFKTFEDLIIEASNYLRDKMRKAENTVKTFVLLWRRIKRYMDFQKIEHFSSSVGKEYIEKKISSRPYNELSKAEKNAVHSVKILCQFYDTGAIMPRRKPMF